MLAELLAHLVCPACLPEEETLVADVRRFAGDDIGEGRLRCPACGAGYPIADGLARLTPPRKRSPKSQEKYDDSKVLASYLWAHYAGSLGDPEAGPGLSAWEALVPRAARPGSLALDLGCAVGGMSFALARAGHFAVGLDLSLPFALAARGLARGKPADFAEPVEGEIARKRRIPPPVVAGPGKVEIIQASALRPPFRKGAAQVVTSLNLLDKVPDPPAHLREIGRMAACGSTLVFADPFSWSREAAPRSRWLGGFVSRGREVYGLEAVKAALRALGFELIREEDVWWRLKNHANHFELIRSKTLAARRLTLP